MDSGLLNSQHHFSINAPIQDRVALRKLVTCAVLDPAVFIVRPEEETVESAGKSSNASYNFLNVAWSFVNANDTGDSPLETDQLQIEDGFYYTKSVPVFLRWALL